MVKPGGLPGPCEPGVLPGTVRTVLAKPGVECSPDLPRVAASERERTHKSQTRRSAPTKVQPSHPRGGLDLGFCEKISELILNMDVTLNQIPPYLCFSYTAGRRGAT